MIKSSSAYSILGFSGNLFLSKDGSVGACFLVTNPEPYSLDMVKLDLRHESFVRSFRNIDDGIYVQKQDIVLEETYSSSKHYFRNTFLTEAESRHFDGREGIKHYCLLSFTITELASLKESYVANPLKYTEKLTKKDKERLSRFFDKVKSSVGILNKLYNTTITALEENELRYFFLNYVNGFQSDQGLRDLVFDNKLHIGDNHYSIFSISDSSYLPDTITNVSDDTTINVENLKLYKGLMDDFGVHLPFNHIYNQVLYFPGHKQLKDELEMRVEQYEKSQSFSTALKREFTRLKEVEKELLDNNVTLCKSHFNIIAWHEDTDELRKRSDAIKGIFDDKEISYYIPSYEGLENIFLSTIVGRQSKLHKDYLFLNTLQNACCMLTNYSYYSDDEEGIVVQDRLLQVPYRLDWWDRKNKRINARNFIIYAPTGSGKSADVLNMAYQFLEDGVTLVIAEFGSSFEQLTKLYPKESKHIKVNSNTALGINPFNLEGRKLTNEKLFSLTAVVMKFWRLPAEIKREAKKAVAITKTLQDYYEQVKRDHHFISYYNHVVQNFRAICERKDFPEEYFDINSFKVVCSEFLEGGIYHNVVSSNSEINESIGLKSAIVFELNEIKNNPFLVSVIMTILFDAINEKILKDKTKRGYFIFDEMALGSELKDNYSGIDIMSTISLITASIRKENGAVGLIFQTPTQMPKNNQYTDSIIGNMQILGVLEGNEQVYDAIIERHKLKNNEHIQMMKSVSNNFTADRPYSEKFVRFNENYATIIRNEFSREKFLAFQTTGEIWAALQSRYEQIGDMEETIIEHIKSEEYEKV
ncbi:conjugal transfer protein TraG [Croceitalea sp. MTPC9]|uniref:TraG/VirB4 family ATPase n=1 Tax=unclassified Croceitalea TaxID=2632280 RepID=UPI002B3C33C0|nr:conjugal transfer protein TraG [Croceitalea sp. MTPC6]GMN18553.1 conjugal transfer protein TraG [Croceitalea sp. MTPC9]